MLNCHNTQEEKEEEEENDRMKFLIYIKQQPKNERHVQFNRIRAHFYISSAMKHSTEVKSLSPLNPTLRIT